MVGCQVFSVHHKNVVSILNKSRSLLFKPRIAEKFLKVQRSIYGHDIKFPSISVFIRCRQDSPSQIGLTSVKHSARGQYLAHTLLLLHAN